MSDPAEHKQPEIIKWIVGFLRAVLSAVSGLFKRWFGAMLRFIWPSYATSLSLRERIYAGLVVFLFVGVSWAALYISFTAGRVFAEHGNKLFGTGVTISDLQARQTELETALATEQAQRQIERATYAKVAHDLAELQSQISEQNEELGFYRSVMTPRNLPFGIKVQQVKILPTESIRRYKIQVVMIGDNRSAQVEQVSADLFIEGVRNGLPVTLPVEKLNSSQPRLNFNFRYFDEQQLILELPSDVYPKHLVVEVHSPHFTQALRQSMPWRVQPL
jgi:hypothetical protein